MRFHVDLSREAQEQFHSLPKDARKNIGRAIDELEERDDSQWSNVKALHGPEWKGRLRKTTTNHWVGSVGCGGEADNVRAR